MYIYISIYINVSITEWLSYFKHTLDSNVRGAFRTFSECRSIVDLIEL